MRNTNAFSLINVCNSARPG
uniref:Uncharacterized protein n=1 Tax=Anguilla anguilla TaxID=7936 RepID=A0A0E9RNN3_ANGAN